MQISGTFDIYFHGKVKTLRKIPALSQAWAEQDDSIDLDELEEELELGLEDLEDSEPGEVETLEIGLDFEDWQTDWLEKAVAAHCPDLEIALVAQLDYSVCGAALYACYSPAGSKTVLPEDWNGEWFPPDKQTAAWEESIKEAGEIDLGFPKDVDWLSEIDFLGDEDGDDE